MNYPVLYTFRRCPYAIRARMALAYAGVDYEVREVVLREKPAHMLEVSPKGTVPVLLLDDLVLDESLDIMHWALARTDPGGWWNRDQTCRRAMAELIDRCEKVFKPELDGYKYSTSSDECLKHRNAAQDFLQQLEDLLTDAAHSETSDRFLFGDSMSFADVCVFPFVRQFAHVDKAWFDGSPYPHLQRWLALMLADPLFLRVMTRYPQWHEGDPVTRAEKKGSGSIYPSEKK